MYRAGFNFMATSLTPYIFSKHGEAKKRKLLMSVADGDDAHAVQALAQERANEAEVTNLMRRDLDSNIRRGTCLTADITAIVVLDGPMKLDGLGAKVLPWDLGCVAELLTFRHVVWAAHTREAQSDMIKGVETEVCLASRMLGGWIAGPEWTDACARGKQLYEPVLRLARAVSIPKEMRVHESCSFGHALEKICIAAASNTSGGMKWTLRDSRKKLWLS